MENIIFLYLENEKHIIRHLNVVEKTIIKIIDKETQPIMGKQVTFPGNIQYQQMKDLLQNAIKYISDNLKVSIIEEYITTAAELNCQIALREPEEFLEHFLNL